MSRLRVFFVLTTILCALAVPKSFAQGKNIMIISPHEDDDTLFGAGVIYAAQQRGDHVTVVWVTNGDIGGVSSGYDRQAQSVRAMSELGVFNQQLVFLGYGDSTLQTLYQSSPNTIVTSAAGMNHTYAGYGLGSVDYHSFLTGSPGDYNRATILSDMEALLTNFLPDDVYTTSYFDHHPDHACTFLFTVEALTTLKRQGIALNTRVHDSVVWADSDQPWPTGGAAPTIPFSAPTDLGGLPYNWADAELIPVPAAMQDANLNTNVKYQTLLQYMSQPSNFFASFIKKDEFFWVHDYATNLALTATVLASSQDSTNTAMKAIDGVVEQDYGFVGDWQTVGESTGAWIRLNWSNPVTLSHIVLYDRPSMITQVLSGTLLFSDGSTVPVGTLPNKGSALHVSFAPRTVSWVQFTLDNAQGPGIGLSEIEAYGVVAGSQTNNAPQILAGPASDQLHITELQSANLSVSAFDVDGDNLQYDWLTDGGTITTGGPTALFQPSPVSADTVVTITANVTDGRGGKATNSTFLSVSPSVVKVQSVTLSPTNVQGGATATGTVTLGSVAKSGGTLVQLASSDSTIAIVPTSVTVPSGATFATFSVSTVPVSSLGNVTISAACGGVIQTASLTVTPPSVAVASLTLNPASVIAGDSSTATVTLAGPATGSGTVVSLASNNVVATVPATVTVPAGSSSATFSVKTSLTSSSLTAAISASAGGGSASSDLRVTARIAANLATAASVSVSSESAGTGQLGIKAIDTIVDGYPGDYSKEWATNGQLAGAWLQLNWANAVTVSQVVLYDRPNPVDNILGGSLLFSDGSTVSVGAVPDNGGLTVTFSPRTVTSLRFQVSNAVGSNIGLAEIAVYGPALPTISSVSLNPASVVGGNSTAGTVTLSGPAPAGGAVITLASDNTSAATVPNTITVSSNATTAAFTVNTSSVTSNSSATISAAYNSSAQSAILTVTPAQLVTITFNPSSVQGGSPSTGTVTLNGPAPASGAVVALAGDNPAAVTVPASVMVAANATSGTFQVSTNPVTSNTSANISATYIDVTQTAALTVTTPVLNIAAVTLNPGSVQGGISSTGTVTLNHPAPAGGVLVSLASDNPSVANVPASVLVGDNATAATFSVSTNAVASDTSATISAAYSNVTQSAKLVVTAPPLALISLSINPATLLGGSPSTGSVTLNAPAPPTGVVVLLASDNTNIATVPASVSVAAGATFATFPIGTNPVVSSTSVTISATYGSNVRAGVLTVTPAVLSAVTLNPSAIQGGSTSLGTVMLSGPAPSNGASVTLSSSNPGAANVPVSVTVAANATSATFVVSTTPVSVNASSTISATYGSTTQTALLTVSAATLSSVSLNPASVRGGSSSTGTVTMNGPAPAGGALVTLSTSNAAAASLPANVTVAANSRTATFTVTTSPVGANTPLTISAVYGGTTQTASFTVTAASLTSVSLSPTSVRGGSSSRGTVTLNGPAPAGGAVVTLLSNNPGVATVPVNVTVGANATSASFTITTIPVGVNTSVTISAIYGGTTRTAVLTVSAATLSSVSLSPTSVKGGGTSTGTVTLNGPAPAAGAVVTLSSSNTGVATVPTSVTIVAGATTSTFTVRTSTVTSNRNVTITAVRGATQRATLTVTP